MGQDDGLDAELVEPLHAISSGIGLSSQRRGRVPMGEQLSVPWCAELANALANISWPGVQRRKLIDAIPTPIWWVSSDGAAEILNKAWLDYSGLSEQAAVKKGWREIIHPDDRERYASEWLNRETSGTAGGVQVRLRRNDGAYQWFWVEAAPARDAQGRVVGWCATQTEICEPQHLGSLGTPPSSSREPVQLGASVAPLIEALSRLVEENEALREDFRDLFEEAPIAYVHEDLDSRFIRANRAAIKMLGLRPDEVAGAVGKSFVADTPENQRSLHEAFSAVREGSEPADVVLELRRKDNGAPIWVQWRSKPAASGDFTRTMMVDITDRILTEQTKSALELSFDSGRVEDWDLDLVHDRSRRSLRHDQCFGYAQPIPDADWGLEPFLRHVHPDDRNAVADGVREAVEELHDWAAEFRVVWPDGSVHWLIARGRIHEVVEGRATRMLGVVMDVTERRMAEETLRETKAALEFALESTQIGDWDLDLVHDTSRRSLRHDRCFGYDAPIADWGVKSFIQHVHPEDRVRVETSMADAVAALEDWSSEFRVVWPDQSLHWLFAAGSIYRTIEGKATRMLGIVMDITARKQAELDAREHYADLQEWEVKFRGAIDTIPGLAWFCRPDGSAEFLSRQWCEYTGLSLEEALDWKWAIAIHPDDLPDLERHWRENLTTCLPAEHEARIRRFDGEYRWFLFRCAPMFDSAGAVVRWYGANIDIEERKRAEKALLASEQLVRGQVNALKSSLDALAMEPDSNQLVAHILRTITEQFGAHSSSVWRRGEPDGMIGLEFAFENGCIVTKADPRFAGLDLLLPMEGIWPWPEVFRTGEPSVIEDIRTVPPFALRDRLLPLGIITVLLVPMMVAGRLEGVIGLRFKQGRTFRTEEIELAQALANQAMLMIQLAELSAQNRESAVTAERNRIARDIHDTLAQGFTGVIVQLEAAEDAQAQGLPNETSAHLIRARDLARDSLNEARRSVQALRPLALDKGEFSAALNTMFERMVEGTRIKLSFAVLGQPRALPPDWEENLFRIGQEILTNALRHAQASHFTAKIIFSEDDVRLDLRDDGCGFELMAKSDGFGLLGIRERVEAVGGRLEIQSSRGRGAEVLISLPTPVTSLAGV